MKTTTEHTTWRDPLIERYASRDMMSCFSSEQRYTSWRRIWLALAEAQHELGLPISKAQLNDIRKALDEPVDFGRVAQLESELHHDVMAHLHAFGERCPEAKPILHLGATSAFVTDNADMMLMRDGLNLLGQKLQHLTKSLGAFCMEHRSRVTIGYTHFQVAMPTTVGKRAALWLHDWLLDGEELVHRLSTLRTRGAKGTTGTQASFLKLFDGDHTKVAALDERVAKALGFERSVAVCGQTYSRKLDTQILALLSGIAESSSKFANDIRLLAHLREIEEPFGKKQVGSSAMPFKRNPILSERICSLARLLMSMTINGSMTTATQWLERSLDDSANRRLIMPRAFLLADALLGLAQKIVDGIQVHSDVIQRNYEQQKPFLLTEMLLMESVKEGESRQTMHETIRQLSMEAFERLVQGAPTNDLIEQMKKVDTLAPLIERMTDEQWESKFMVGRAAEQVEALVDDPNGLLATFLNRSF